MPLLLVCIFAAAAALLAAPAVRALPAAVVSIDAHGARANDSSLAAAVRNSNAITAALAAANATAGGGVVLVPPRNTYYIMRTAAAGLVGVTLRVAGELRVSNNMTNWPVPLGGAGRGGDLNLAALEFDRCRHFTIDGGGVIDGQGYEWWLRVITSPTHADHRPHMLLITRSADLLIENVRLRNSPQFHLKLTDVVRVVVRHIDIYVDVVAQRQLVAAAYTATRGVGGDDRAAAAAAAASSSSSSSSSSWPWPTFPLNTDGIDPAGRDIEIYNVTIENWDDAVAVKPLSGANTLAQCAENIVVRDSHVTYGVGMTIGSVPPHAQHNCVRNVTFQRITFDSPIKAIYIKTNPGTVGTGEITDIAYRDIVAHGSVWYPIWIGPQQQRQPGTPGTGCSFLYPWRSKQCPTQPRVPIRNVTIANAVFRDGDTLPGVLLCDPAKRCDIHLKNVTNTGTWEVMDNYWCMNVDADVGAGSDPVPMCM